MPKSPPHPISTPIPELHGIATIASPAQGEWISVPREPTEGMLGAWASSDRYADDWRADCASGWSAMLAAAPVAPSSGEWIEREAAADEAYRDAWSDFEGEHLCDGNDGYRDAATYKRCREAFDTAWHDRVRPAALAALRALELPSTPKPQELAGER